MRKTVLSLGVALLFALVGCVTINVYFPEAAAEQAADQFIGSVIGGPEAADTEKDDDSSDTPPVDGRGNKVEPKPSASVLDLIIPAAYAATPNLRVHTPAVDAIHDRMRARYKSSLKSLLESGAVGFTQDGMVAVRDAASVPLSQRSKVNSTVAEDNRDRAALYREIASANGHPEWESQVRETFARQWIEKARSGWYYRNASGAWVQK